MAGKKQNHNSAAEFPILSSESGGGGGEDWLELGDEYEIIPLSRKSMARQFDIGAIGHPS